MTAWIDSLEARKAALAAVPYLADLPVEDLSALARSAVVKRWRKGQTVFEEGEACHGLYVVASGCIRILRLSAAGREQVLHTESEGAVGEAPLLDGGPYPACGRAASDLVTLFVAREAVLDWCHRRPEIALGLAVALAGRVRRFAALAESLSLHQVSQRLAAYLLERAESSQDFEARAADAPADVVLEETNQEIAAQIGTVRELVSRLLGDFKRRGLIRLRGRRVIIPDLDRLRDQSRP